MYILKVQLLPCLSLFFAAVVFLIPQVSIVKALLKISTTSLEIQEDRRVVQPWAMTFRRKTASLRGEEDVSSGVCGWNMETSERASPGRQQEHSTEDRGDADGKTLPTQVSSFCTKLIFFSKLQLLPQLHQTDAVCPPRTLFSGCVQGAPMPCSPCPPGHSPATRLSSCLFKLFSALLAKLFLSSPIFWKD